MNKEAQIILMVEDNPDDYMAAQRAFNRSSLVNPLVWCERAEQALDYLNQRGDYTGAAYKGVPGVILLDLNLPGMNGQEFLVEIKQDSSLQRIPVIVISSSDDPEDINRCYDYGASSYVLKPVVLDNFLQAVQRLSGYHLELEVLPAETAV